MTYRFSLIEVLEDIETIREALRDLVLSMSRPGERWWQDVGLRWSELAESLGYKIQQAERHDQELRQILYERALSGISAPAKPIEQPNPSLPRLHYKLKKALEYIRRKGHVKGQSIAAHVGVDPKTFTRHYVKILHHYGVRNDQRGDGYYILDNE